MTSVRERRQSRLVEALHRVVPAERVFDRTIDRVAFASDASCYRLVPRAVVLAAGRDEVRALFGLAREQRVPLTFRAAGTSLSGQAVTDGLLVEVARHWKSISVEGGGALVRFQPGVIGAQVNRRLAPLGRKIGPDPASINACTMGGILANNSSGMCCGVARNAYHTLESLSFVLPSGTCFDTAEAQGDDRFRSAEPELWRGLHVLKDRIESDRALVDRIRAKYRMKNTVGYSLNAFLDFERALDIFAHLLIGSEGTLAFIAEAVLRTVPDLQVKHTGLLYFADLHAACAAIEPLAAAGAQALELMDRASLRSVEAKPGIPEVVRRLPSGAAGLLTEFQCADEAGRQTLEEAARRSSRGLRLLEPAAFTNDPARQATLWMVRQGLFASVGATRRPGTTVIIEDVAVPVSRLADASQDLNRLFQLHGYHDAIIFGHAKDGNLHFVLNQAFGTEREIEQYARFIDDVVALVVGRHQGALKAEHGTGRNMAPFVAIEWGEDAVAIMRRVKALADPDGLLNPGVILSDDPRGHLANLKSLPAVDETVDLCIECGYCESRCPSRELTTTPRQRIVVLREIERKRTAGDRPGATELARSFAYDGLDTCAVDGLCAIACPVGIDTGSLVKRLRHQRHSPLALWLAQAAARDFHLIERALRLGLRLSGAVQAILGDRVLSGLSRVVRTVTRGAPILWLPPMPAAAEPPPRTKREGAVALFLPSCLTRMLGALPGEPAGSSPAEALVAISRRAERPVWIPPDVAGHCCGVPFSSKGYREAHRQMAIRTVAALWRWSEEGRLPVVVDTSPCSHGLRASRAVLPEELATRFDRLRIVDAISWVAQELLPRLTVRRRQRRVVLHPVCSAEKMGLTAEMERIARACAEEVVIPASAGCCGFAGDRGWLVPELTAAATRAEAAEARSVEAEGHYSSSRTCEIGLTRATGRVYRSFLHLLDEATRPGERQLASETPASPSPRDPPSP